MGIKTVPVCQGGETNFWKNYFERSLEKQPPHRTVSLFDYFVQTTQKDPGKTAATWLAVGSCVAFFSSFLAQHAPNLHPFLLKN